MEILKVNSKHEIKFPNGTFDTKKIFLIRCPNYILLFTYEQGLKLLKYVSTINRKNNLYWTYISLCTRMIEVEIKDNKMKICKRIIDEYDIKKELLFFKNEKNIKLFTEKSYKKGFTY